MNILDLSLSKVARLSKTKQNSSGHPFVFEFQMNKKQIFSKSYVPYNIWGILTEIIQISHCLSEIQINCTVFYLSTFDSRFYQNLIKSKTLLLSS